MRHIFSDRTAMQIFNDFITKLKEKLAGPLPGLDSQLRMASMRRVIEQGRMKVPADVKKGGVLVLFYPHQEQVYLVLMKRTEYPGVHSGQISFPGGGWEPEDQNMTETALRETEEEIGVKRQLVRPVGFLSELFIPPSNFLVTPVVGYIEARPEFRPDPSEVAQIVEIPLNEFLREENRLEKNITVYPDIRMRVPCFYINGNVIWGATAMMINELIDLLTQGS